MVHGHEFDIDQRITTIYVITSRCTRQGNCVEACPVNCIVPGLKDDPTWGKQFYIDPLTCIGCGACVLVCPPGAIFVEDQLPPEHEADADRNMAFFDEGPGYWDFDLDDQRSQS